MTLTQLAVWDVALPGRRVPAGTIELRESPASARDLIRCRVRQGVDRYNSASPERFAPLVEPEETERLLNGVPDRRLDWEAQFARACSAFERNGFLLLIDGEQVTSLDDPIALREDSEVEFVKLVPLVGGIR